MMRPNNKRFSMTYTEQEAPILVPIEYRLMKELGLRRSDLHKVALKEFYNRRQQSALKLIWGKYEKARYYWRSKRNAVGPMQEVEDETFRSYWGMVRRKLLSSIQEEKVSMDFQDFADMRTFNPHLNQIYYELNPENKDEYRTVRVYMNPFTNHPQAQRSNWVTGSPPDHFKVLPPMLNRRIHSIPQHIPFWWLERMLARVGSNVMGHQRERNQIWLTVCSVHIASERGRRRSRSY